MAPSSTFSFKSLLSPITSKERKGFIICSNSLVRETKLKKVFIWGSDKVIVHNARGPRMRNCFLTHNTCIAYGRRRCQLRQTNPNQWLYVSTFRRESVTLIHQPGVGDTLNDDGFKVSEDVVFVWKKINNNYYYFGILDGEIDRRTKLITNYCL